MKVNPLRFILSNNIDACGFSITNGISRTFTSSQTNNAVKSPFTPPLKYLEYASFTSGALRLTNLLIDG